MISQLEVGCALYPARAVSGDFVQVTWCEIDKTVALKRKMGSYFWDIESCTKEWQCVGNHATASLTWSPSDLQSILSSID